MGTNQGDNRGPGMPGISGNQFGRDESAQQTGVCYPEIIWGLDDSQPSTLRYIREDDFIVVGLAGRIASAKAFVNYRMLRPDGSVFEGNERLASFNGVTLAYSSIQPGEGFLLGISVTPQNAVAPSVHTYCVVGIQRGAASATNYLDVLCAGYAYQNCPLSYPSSALQQPIEGNGAIRVIVGTNPGAGVEITETVPANARWQLVSMRATLVTAVAAANRQVQLMFDDGANVFFASTPGAAQAASLTNNYTFASFGYAPALILTEQQIHFDPAIVLGAGSRIRTVTAALQAADDWGAPIYEVREWAEA